MRVVQVAASLHRVPVEVPLLAARLVGVVIVRIETDDGQAGFGVAGGGFQASLVDVVNREIGPFLLGRDPLLMEGLSAALEQRFNARGMSGVVSCALSGVDLALWACAARYWGSRRGACSAATRRRCLPTSRSGSPNMTSTNWQRPPGWQCRAATTAGRWSSGARLSPGRLVTPMQHGARRPGWRQESFRRHYGTEPPLP
jgi:hypothetical protein